MSLPVPLDQAFTYALPLTLQHRVQAGARVLVPFGTRKLTGVVLRAHDDSPETPLKEALRLIDAEPVLDEELLALARWISGYYCAPLGEVLRSMLPLATETRSGKIYSLTDAGRDASRQLSIQPEAEDTASRLVAMLAARPLSAATLKRKIPLADRALKSLRQRGWVEVEDVSRDRDPLRAHASKLRIELSATELTATEPDGKLTKAERELLAYLSLHPGTHNLAEIEASVPHANQAARPLARKHLVALTPEPLVIRDVPIRAPHDLNAAQRNAFDLIGAAIGARSSPRFCCTASRARARPRSISMRWMPRWPPDAAP